MKNAEKAEINKDKKETTENTNMTSNFIHSMIDEYLEANPNNKIHTRFPPEPNGYLHIGHAKAICIDFGTAEKYKGLCNLRFDDTNPTKEDVEYVESIKKDVQWLGFDWGDRAYYASNYFDKFYECAIKLIKKGKAYVDDLNAEQMREYRGTLKETGKNSPYRERSVEENLELFEKMRKGEFEDGSRVLRAKIDMESPNLNMRDPVIYRISHVKHHNTGDKWHIYPMYDFAHPLEDAIEGITHSLCTLEFEDHRPLYEWVLKECEVVNPPRQIEFARLNVTNMITSKRKLKAFVDDNIVDGWDDPRMPTISGLRRRGYTPEAIKDFCERVGVAKADSTVDIAMLEHCLRDDLKLKAPRVMAVLDPIKVVITNYPEKQIEYLDVDNNQENPEMGLRKIPFSRVIYVDREDFMENPPKKYFRLFPGNEVRLKNAYFIKCNEVIKNDEGEIKELHCTYDPETKSGSGFKGRKVKGTIHWVSAKQAIDADVRLYDYLLLEDEENKGEMKVNPNSLTIQKAKIEPSLANAKLGEKFQFMRHGYFCVDTKDTTKGKLVFNRVVSLKSSWKKKK